MAGDTLDIDLTSPAFMRDPLPTLARLREAGPVVRPLPRYRALSAPGHGPPCRGPSLALRGTDR